MINKSAATFVLLQSTAAVRHGAVPVPLSDLTWLGGCRANFSNNKYVYTAIFTQNQTSRRFSSALQSWQVAIARVSSIVGTIDCRDENSKGRRRVGNFSGGRRRAVCNCAVIPGCMPVFYDGGRGNFATNFDEVNTHCLSVPLFLLLTL